MKNETSLIGKNQVNPHGVKVSFGKHKDELITRVPVSYLKWMINEKTPQYEVAKAEFERRGDTMPKVELTGHAIDNASLRVRKIWHETRGKDEGLYSWLQRMTLEAIEHGEPMGDEVHWYKGMKFCITEGEEFPTLKTIMRNKTLDKT
jgi:hypothetical protein